MRNYFKVHACCRNFQSGIDAALQLRQQHDLRSSDIVCITADTFGVPARDNAEPTPANVLAAKESFPVSLALCQHTEHSELVIFEPLVFGTFLFVVWFASKIYRVGILMYGKKPTWKELYKWLKY